MNETELLILGIGVSEHKTDGVIRFEHFCRVFNLPYQILGDGKIWKGGDMSVGAGGGQKINEVLEAIENMENRLIILCDTFDLFPLAGSTEIIKKFNKICDKDSILFSSEVFCWPDSSLSKSYPKQESKYRYLNSGSIMGYRDNIYNMIKNGLVNDNDDDQLFFTYKYLSEEKIILDHKCELFQAVNGSKDDLIIHKNRIYNKYTNSYPVFIHGNGPAKLFLNHVENYIEPQPFYNYAYTMQEMQQMYNQPAVFIAAYVDSDQWTSFQNFITSISKIDYQNKKICIYDKSNNSKADILCNDYGYTYRFNVSTYEFQDFKELKCAYYFMLEQRCTITNTNILHELIPMCNGYHRIISPMLTCKTKNLYSNFWGDLGLDGYYARSGNYIELVQKQLRGLWNVPYVTGAILFSREIIENYDIMRDNKFGDNDMRLCFNLRRDTLFMYMCNLNTYGFIEA